MIKHITDASFNEEIKKSMPVVIDFWAPWCGPCKMLGPVLEEVGVELEGKVKVAKINVDENEITAERYGVSSIPTILIFKEGKVVDKMVGFKPKNTIISWIDKHV
jgi:thioredoxin 1